jgi:hypothetical protein
MSEVAEGTPAADQPDPTVEAPETTPEVTPEAEAFTEVDPNEAPEGEVTQEWLQERYKQMQADYTRKRQADAEAAKQRAEELEFLESLRTDRETQQAVYEQLLEILAESDGEETEEGSEGSEEPSELERTVRELQAAEEERQAAALAKNVVSHIEQLAKDANVELDDQDLKELFDGAIAGEQVNADSTANAFKAWQERRKALHDKWQKDYLASKQAPTPLPAGQSATDKPDLSDPDVRRAHMAAIINGGRS